NSLVVDANNVSTTTGVQNLQVTDADVSAVIGGGALGTSGNGGVSIVASGGAYTDGFTISNSTLSVDGNQTMGSVTGNSATNALAVKGTTIGSGSDLAGSEASFATNIVASADHSVSNVQAVTGDADLNSTVNGRFSIDTWLD